MKVNESKTERIIRVAVGIALLSMVVTGPQSLWGLIGIVPLMTGLIGSCPLYTILGISSCKKCAL